MANCRDCGGFVVFLRKPDGTGYMRPLDPVVLEDEGEQLFVADAEGVGKPPPQLFRTHVCITPEEMTRRRKEHLAEKQALINADRERRRVAREAEEALEAKRREKKERKRELEETREQMRLEAEEEKEEHRVQKAMKTDAEVCKRRTPQHLLVVGCRDCGADPDWPCFAMTDQGHLYDPQIAAGGRWQVERGWYTENPHGARYADGPPNPIRAPRPVRWGEDYRGPWPPAHNDPGRYDMRAWLTLNYGIFATDDRSDPDWMFRLSRRERGQMARFVRTGASILWGDAEEVSDGTGTVAQEPGSGRSEGVLRNGGADGPGPDAREVEAAGDPVRVEGSGRPLEGDREQEDRG